MENFEIFSKFAPFLGLLQYFVFMVHHFEHLLCLSKKRNKIHINVLMLQLGCAQGMKCQKNNGQKFTCNFFLISYKKFYKKITEEKYFYYMWKFRVNI